MNNACVKGLSGCGNGPQSQQCRQKRDQRNRSRGAQFHSLTVSPDPEIDIIEPNLPGQLPDLLGLQGQ